MARFFQILKFKTLLTILLILTVAIGVYLTLKVGRIGDHQAQEFFISQAELVAAAVDPNDVSSFSGNDEELRTAAYKRTLTRLTRIKNTMEDARFIYLMRLKDNKVIFIVDAEDPRSKDYSPPGQIYSNPSQNLKAIFIHGKPLIEGPLHDQWGDWVSAHAPIFDPKTGKVIAISGIDINSNTWMRHLRFYQYSCMIISALLILLMFGSIFLHNAVKHWQDAEEKVNKMARFDALTGLPNRYLINEILLKAIEKAKNNHSKFALLFLDMDNFKWVNDNLGHSMGDLLLQEVASRLKQTLRSTDTVGRLGGDEFIFILENLADDDNAFAIAESIEHAVSQPLSIPKLEHFAVAASIGIAVYPKHGDTAEKLMSNADRAMYRAKKSPLNQIIQCD